MKNIKSLNYSIHHLYRTIIYITFISLGLAFGYIIPSFLKQFGSNSNLLNLHLSLQTQTIIQNISPEIANPINNTSHGTYHLEESPSKLQQPSSDNNLLHEMEDEELFRKASMITNRTERLIPVDLERPLKVSFLFLVRGPLPLSPLWEKFFKGHQELCSIYVHTHPSFNETVPASSVFHGRRIPSKEVIWGRFNMVEAERRLLANALLDPSNQRFILLSESCIPLFNFTTIYAYLMNSTKSYVETYDLHGPTGRGRYNHQLKPIIMQNQWRKGSQWFEMGRDTAFEVTLDKTISGAFQRKCKRRSCCADEHYFATFVSMKFWGKNSGRSLTWVDWSRGGRHPFAFKRKHVTLELLDKMRFGSQCEYNGKITNVCFLFSRKFLPSTLGRLLRFGLT